MCVILYQQQQHPPFDHGKRHPDAAALLFESDLKSREEAACSNSLCVSYELVSQPRMG